MKRERRKKLPRREWAQITTKRPVVVRRIPSLEDLPREVRVNGYWEHAKLVDVGSEEEV